MPGDPNWASCVYFPDFTGANGNTVFTDQSDVNRSITNGGAAETQDNALSLSGASGSYLSTVDTADIELGTGPFTIAAIVNVGALGTLETIAAKYASGARSWWFRINADGTLGIVWSTTGADTAVLDTTTTITASTDVEVLIDRDETDDLRLYIAGGMEASVSNPAVYDDNGSAVRIGATNLSPFNRLSGSIRQFKMWVGTAVVGSDAGYTPGSIGLFDVGPVVPPAQTGGGYILRRLRR